VSGTTAFLLSEFRQIDLVEDDAVVFSFNDLQVARTPLQRTLLAREDAERGEEA
jgi:hypothetical protein